MKNTLRISLLLYGFLLFSACSNDRNEDEFFEPTITEAFKWFAKLNSIDYDYSFEEDKVIPSSSKTRDLRIQINRIKAEIKGQPEWEFAYQNYEHTYLSLGKCLFQIETVFINNSEQLIWRQTYYFDLFENDLDEHPLPITSKIEVLQNEELNTIKNERIWKGDFDYIITQINKE
jgi:hypothetical protein